MPRISGIDIPNDKRIETALTYIFGIGPALSKKILTETGIDLNKRAKDLNDTELAKIREAINKFEIPIEGELKRIVMQNVRRLQEITSYRGQRHKIGLPVRGQSTKRNARTRKGKKKTVGGMKKKLAKK